MSSDNFRFSESDSLLCYHGPMLYEAKCLKRRKSNDGKAQYYIHYKGWNSKWEEWVDDNRVLAVNIANMNKMALLKEIHSSSKKGVAKRSITVIKEEPIRNTTPPVKARKMKHSEISTESEQIINVPSPSSSETKAKKRGRPPKSLTNSLSETIDETDPSEGTVQIVEPVKTVPKKESVKIEKIEETKVDKRAEANKEKNKTLETNKADAVLIAALPVIKTIPKINIPLLLKKRKAYDKVMITQYNKVLKFSKNCTTERVIRAYLYANEKLGVHQRETACSIGLTLTQYFNLLINKNLLYSEEIKCGIKEKAYKHLIQRVSKKEVKVLFKDRLFSKNVLHCVYGPTYLLRLFDELPKLLACTNYNEKDMSFIVQNLEKFLKFLEKNYDKAFSESDYIDVNLLK